MATIFPNAPLLRPIENNRWIVEEDFIIFHKGKQITIKKGFETDGASIPNTPLIRWIIGHPFSMPLLPDAIGHDGLYAAELLPRSQCDWIFLELMKRSKIGWLKRNAVWSAVRIGGAIVWAGHKTDDVIKAREFVTVRKLQKHST